MLETAVAVAGGAKEGSECAELAGAVCRGGLAGGGLFFSGGRFESWWAVAEGERLPTVCNILCRN